MLIDFLKEDMGDEGLDLDDNEIINKKLENLKRLKFDDQKWEIQATNFIILYRKNIKNNIKSIQK